MNKTLFAEKKYFFKHKRMKQIGTNTRMAF